MEAKPNPELAELTEQFIAGERGAQVPTENHNSLPATVGDALQAAKNREAIIGVADRTSRELAEQMKETGGTIDFDSTDSNGNPVSVIIYSTERDPMAPIGIYTERVDNDGKVQKAEHILFSASGGATNGRSIMVPVKGPGSANFNDPVDRFGRLHHVMDPLNEQQPASLDVGRDGNMFDGEQVVDRDSRIYAENTAFISQALDKVRQQSVEL